MRVALFFGFYERSGWMVESRLCLPTSLSDRESKKMTGVLVHSSAVCRRRQGDKTVLGNREKRAQQRHDLLTLPCQLGTGSVLRVFICRN